MAAALPTPCPEWKRSIMRVLVSKYPYGGMSLERALSDAIDIAFAAGHTASSGVAALPAADPLPDSCSEKPHA